LVRGSTTTGNKWVKEDTISSGVGTNEVSSRISGRWEDSVGSKTSDGEPLSPVDNEVLIIELRNLETWSLSSIRSLEQPSALGFTI
jgi:hypothetical protein